MAALVIAELHGAELGRSTLSAICAAGQLRDEVDLLVAGQGMDDLASAAARVAGVRRVLVADAAHYAQPIAEELCPLAASLADGYEDILAPATTFGKNLMPRLAATLDCPQISDIIGIEGDGGEILVRPIYAGNAMARVRSTAGRRIITVRPTAFAPADASGGAAQVEAVDAAAPDGRVQYKGLRATASERPELATAARVVSGGRALASRENFALIEALADKLGAAIGASRAAVDAGFVPNDYQVGQTGKVVAPELYIAVGISGAIQHLAGMKDSKTIVAINKDPEAPIFKIADYGLVGDLFAILPELIKAL